MVLKSLIKGIGIGTGVGIGQQLTNTVIQNMMNKKGGNSAAVQAAERDIKCNSCGALNTGDSKFCGACGNSLAARYDLQNGVTCSCGYTNAQGQKFCSECGKSLT